MRNALCRVVISPRFDLLFAVVMASMIGLFSTTLVALQWQDLDAARRIVIGTGLMHGQ